MINTDRKKKENNLYALFKKNGYSRSFVQSTLRNCEANRKKRKDGKSEKKKKEPKDTIVLPYVKGVSEQIKRVLTPLDIRVVNRAEKWTCSLSHGIKDSIPVEKQTGVVYEISCKDCDDNLSERHFVRSRHGWLSINDIRRTNALTNRQWQSMRPLTSMTSTGKI